MFSRMKIMLWKNIQVDGVGLENEDILEHKRDKVAIDKEQKFW